MNTLQYVAYPFWFIAAACILYTLYAVLSTINKPDMLPLVGAALGALSLAVSVANAVVGALIWFAFK